MKKFLSCLLVLAIIAGLVYFFLDDDSPETESFTVNGVSFTMVAVEGGTFIMGDNSEQDGEAYDLTTKTHIKNEKPAHKVTVSSFSIGQTEVTQALWLAVMGSNPSCFTPRHGHNLNVNRPVENVSWNECQTFIAKLNKITGKKFRLPTEAEWEFAARGGNLSQGYKYAGSNNPNDVAWFEGTTNKKYSSDAEYGTHTVATKAPNELGLYDMSGNICECVQDRYGSYSSEAQTDPSGPDRGPSIVARGGGYGYRARFCQVSFRHEYSPTSACDVQGFRLAL